MLARVNNKLCQGNESSMFVTLFCGILNLRTGELRYSNAGHSPPLVLSPGQDPQWLDLPPGLVLGGMEDMVSGILQSVHAFASGADQSDDITLLALLYKGQTSAR